MRVATKHQKDDDAEETDGRGNHCTRDDERSSPSGQGWSLQGSKASAFPVQKVLWISTHSSGAPCSLRFVVK